MRIVLSSLYPYAYMLLYMIIPFDDYIRAWPNILMGVLVVAFPFVVSKSDLARIKQVPMLILLGFFAYLVINAVLLGRFEEDLSVLKKILISVGLVLLYLPIQGDNLHRALAPHMTKPTTNSSHFCEVHTLQDREYRSK